MSESLWIGNGRFQKRQRDGKRRGNHRNVVALQASELAPDRVSGRLSGDNPSLRVSGRTGKPAYAPRGRQNTPRGRYRGGRSDWADEQPCQIERNVVGHNIARRPSAD